MRRPSLRGLGPLLLLVGAAGAQAALTPPLPPALPADLQAEIVPLLRASGARGAAVVLVGTAGPSGALWYGSADARRGLPMTPATCVPVGAVSKTFTAMLAMRLSDQGKLALDEPIAADLQPAAPPGCAGRVTLAQLLEHTAGVTEAGRPLAWCPGHHYRDADAGITLAATVLERAGGADFDTLMQREVFAPLGITAASFKTGGSPACLARDEVAALPPSSRDRPANALIATPLDLARVLQTMLRYGDGPVGHVLEPCGIAHMTVGTTGLAGRHGAVAGAYGKGLTRFVAAERPMIGHEGRIAGFQTSIGFAPETAQGMVIVVDSADGDVLRRLRDVVAAHLWRGIPAPPLPPLARPADEVSGWYAKLAPAGSWWMSWVAPLEVVRVDADASGLTLRGLWPWQTDRHVLAVNDHSFREEALPLASMAFARDADGRRWWIDGASHAAVDPAAVIAKLLAWAVASVLALVLALLLAITLTGWVIVRALPKFVRRTGAKGAPMDIADRPRKTAPWGRLQWSD